MKNKNKFPCIESTIDMQIGELGVRLWIDQGELAYPEDTKVAEKVRGIADNISENNLSIADFIDILVQAIDNLNAVQVTHIIDGVKYGTMVYTVEF